MKYTEHNLLGDIISEHYELLLVMCRFGIPMGFGDKSVRSVCDQNNVDCTTFLTVINFVATGNTNNLHNISPKAMMSYLRQSHTYYLSYILPELRERLADAINYTPYDKLSTLVMNFYDNYVEEVREHLNLEDNSIFPYVDGLCNGVIPNSSQSISDYSANHEQIDESLTELKNIILKYYPNNKIEYKLNKAMFDLYATEADLKIHSAIEDNLFIPAVMILEENLRGAK